MDRGYSRQDNINALYKAHLKFLCWASMTLRFTKDFIHEVFTNRDSYEAYNNQLELYVFSKTMAWDYEQISPEKKEALTGKRGMYGYLYFDPEKRAEEGKALSATKSKILLRPSNSTICATSSRRPLGTSKNA